MRIGIQSEQHITNQKNKAIHLKVGDLIYFDEEKKPYKIVGRNEFFLICTKPFNLKKTFLYSIVDLSSGIRGPDNYIFSKYDYSDPIDIAMALFELRSGELGISFRHRISLNIKETKSKSTEWKMQKCPWNKAILESIGNE